MKASALLLQALLVVVGILAYDAWRGRGAPPPPDSGDDVPTRPRAPGDGSARAPASDDPRLAAILARLARLEARTTTQPEASPAPPPRSAREERPPVAIPAAPPLPPPVPDGVEFTAEEVSRFRALAEAAARQRRAEATQRSVASALDRLGDLLSPAERERLLAEAVRAWAIAEQEDRRLDAARAPRTERIQALDAVRLAFHAGVGRILDLVRAEKVLAAVEPIVGLRAGAASIQDEDGPGE